MNIGEDETGCDCEGNQFFCMTKSIKGDSECIDQVHAAGSIGRGKNHPLP